MSKRVFSHYNVYGYFPSGSSTQIGSAPTKGLADEMAKSWLRRVAGPKPPRGYRTTIKKEFRVYPTRNPQRRVRKSTGWIKAKAVRIEKRGRQYVVKVKR